jgi:hypothetical protein
MVRHVYEVARYTKIHNKYYVLISGKLRYPANPWSRKCRISQILLYAASVKMVTWVKVKIALEQVMKTQREKVEV